MKIDRLLGITIYLLNHGRTPAGVLAQHFEVSVRTIVRDIDTLCLAGIPVSSICGFEGGYEILDTFEMQHQIAEEKDYSYVISALQGLISAYDSKEMESTLEKIRALVPNLKQDIVLDFSVAHENRDTNSVLKLLNQMIQKKKKICFQYTNGNDETKEIEAEPVAIIYKWYNWYFIGFYKKAEEYRMYKVIRMNHITETEKENEQIHNREAVCHYLETKTDNRKMLTVSMYCNKMLKSKCLEYLPVTITKEYKNGDFECIMKVPENEFFWYGAILSFGKNARVISPEELINRIKKDCKELLQSYHELANIDRIK